MGFAAIGSLLIRIGRLPVGQGDAVIRDPVVVAVQQADAGDAIEGFGQGNILSADPGCPGRPR